MEQETAMQTNLTNSRMMQQRTTRAATVLAMAALVIALPLTGCGIGGSAAPSGPVNVTGLAVNGKVHGGQNPVKTSTVQLYAAGTTGYGSAATPLGASVTTDSNGNFAITAPYTCPAGGQVYIVATQGDSGSGNNPNLAMMSALGTCPVTSAVVDINEVTTVATVWALAPFMTGITNIGSPSTTQALSGIAAAFADVNTLVDLPTGSTPGSAAPSNATVPTATIYTLANILAGCVNSGGGTASDTSTNCGKLFAATSTGGTPTNTVTAAMNIAQHPGTNVPTIYGLGATSPPFQTALTSQPSDFTLAVTFTGNMSQPVALAADSSGNIWIANRLGNTITKLSQNGTLLSGTGYTNSLNGPFALAFDPSGNLWVTNSGNNTLSKFGSSGTPATNSPYSGGSMSNPVGIAFDSQGNGWITNNVAAGTLTEVVPGSGNTPTFSSYTPSATAHIAVAVSPH
jgi:hypothetical protein